ncbi:MAG: response regulator [Eubacterium sp.]|nr:response regulator [Eubacterium sp.]
MLKVLFVDDEPYILQGFKVLVDWEKENFEIVGMASNGVEALEFLKKNEVDLIVADIKMPLMNGLELLKTVKENNISDAYFVILSGFNDFEYAKEAIHYGCLDYLLKPVKKVELVQILRKINEMSAASKKKDMHYHDTETAYLQRHLISLIVGRYDNVNLNYVLDNMNLSEGVRYVILELPDIDGNETDEGSVMKYRRKLNQAASQILGDDENHLIYDVSLNSDIYDTGFIYCDYMALNRGMDDIGFLNDFQKKLEEAVGEKVKIISGKKVPDISAISKSYSSAFILKSQEVFHESRPIITYEREMSLNSNKTRLCKNSLDNLIEAIEINDQARIHKCVDEFYEDIAEGGLGDSVSLNINYLIFRLIHIAVELDSEVNQEEILHRISENSFEEGIKRGSSRHMCKFVCEYADYLAQLRKNVSGGIMKEIEDEIKEHYSENLSLKKLSEKYYINSSYLGTLFNKKFGVSFKDYLTDYRIKEAAKLLINTDEKVVDIAASVGYKNSDYFIRRFIEIMGMTPSKYRRKNKE